MRKERLAAIVAPVLALLLLVGPAAAQPAATDAQPSALIPSAARARDAGSLAEAETLGRRAIAAAEPGAAADATALYQARIDLSRTFLAQRRFHEAAQELDRAVAIARAGGEAHPAILAPTIQIGNVRLAEGRFDLAEPIYRQGLALAERIHGPDHIQTISLLNDIAEIYFTNGRPDEAQRLLEQARAAALHNPGEREASLIRTLANLSGFYLHRQRVEDAVPVLRDLLDRQTRFDGPDDEQRLFTAIRLGAANVNAGRINEAEPIAADALPRAERALGASHAITLGAASLLGQVRAAQGRFSEAVPLLRRAHEGQERTVGARGRAAIEAANLLARTLNEAGQSREAEALYRRTLAASVEGIGADDPLTLITRNGVATTLILQGRYPEAEHLLREAVAGFERVGAARSLGALQTSGNLASALQQQGKYAEAEALLLRSVEVGEATLGPDHPTILLGLSNLAEIFVSQGRVDEAIPLTERALERAERGTGPDSPRALLFANNLGALLKMQGRDAEAAPVLERVLAGRERIFGFDNRDTLVTATSVAALRMDQGRTAEAEALMRRIAASSERVLGRANPETLSARLNLASLFQRLRRLDEAEPLYAGVLADGSAHLPRGDDRLIEAAGGLAVGRQVARLVRGDRNADALTPARQAVAAIRARRTDRGGRFGAAQASRELMSRGDYFLLLADALWDHGHSAEETTEAFAALQDATAGTTDRAVLQLAIRRFADEKNAGLGALVREREELEGRWTANAQRQVDLLTAPGVTDAERLAVRQEDGRLEARLDAVDVQLRRDFPDFFQLANPEAIDLDRAGSVLAPDEALLLIVPGSRGTHLMTVTHTGISWRVAALTRPQVDSSVRRLLWQLGAAVTPTAEEQAAWSREPATAFDRTLAHRLYRELVAPMNDVLAGKRHVYVAGTGSLSSLPFGVLVTEAPTGSDSDPAALRATSWLADAHALIQVPSVQSMLLLRRFTAPGRGGDRFVGFGDPLLDGQAVTRGRGSRGAAPARPIFAGRTTRSGTALADVGALRTMARLPGTAEELKNMRAALAAPADSIFLGAAATERHFRSMDLSRVRILALATHGITAGQIAGAGEPGLVFTPPAEPSEADDGYLAASEIATLRLNADWVILSACNTAAGDGSEGAPGLSGLARAFFYAGARTLLASHWPVRDDVGARLTVRAVALQRAQPGLSRAEAFQRAMREIRADASHDADGGTWAHPNAWAPFTLIGDAAR